MKPINQAKGFNVCLHGYTLPKYALFGNVYNTLYYVTDLNAHKDTAGKKYYNIHVWREPKKHRHGHWDLTDTRAGFGAIFVRIRDFLKSPDFVNHPVVYCERRYQRALEYEIAAEKARADINRPFEEVAKEACPERRIPKFQYRASAYQLNPGEFYNSAPSVYAGKGADMDVMHNPKMFHKDGLKVTFKDYRPDDDRPFYNGISETEIKRREKAKAYNPDGKYNLDDFKRSISRNTQLDVKVVR